MPEMSRCWACHRTVEEITATVDTETAEEREIKKQMSQVAWYRSKFTDSADLWRRSLPRDFKDMDFQFIATNAGQFSSIKALAEVLDAKKLMLDSLSEAASVLRSGGETTKLLEGVGPLEQNDRDSVLRLIDQFEAKYHRSVGEEGGRNGFANGFDGLKLFDGLEFLIAEGQLYYDVRAQLSQSAMTRAVAKKPRKSMRMVQANGYPPVPLCSVCESLILGLRAPERRVASEPVVSTEAVPEAEAGPAAETEETPQIAEPVPVVQAADTSESVSPQVAEILKKLGPATKDAPKTRNLHEHRVKEDWDELREQQKGN